MDPIELAKRTAGYLFKAKQYLAAAIVYGEALKKKPDDPGLLLGFGVSIGSSGGVLVSAPFVHWATRVLDRCIAVAPNGPEATVAKERLAELEKRSEYTTQPPLEPSDLEPLLDFLDVAPATIMADAVTALAASDRMFAIMGLGELGASRFASAIAKAASGEWGSGPGCAAFKRIRPYAGHRIVRDALVTCRARSDAEEEYGPYLRSAEALVASIPITIETPPGYRKVRPPPTGPTPRAKSASDVAREMGAHDERPVPSLANRPWWKFWN